MNKAVLFPVGILMIVMGVLQMIPAAVDITNHSGDWHTFVFSSIGALTLGGMVLLSSYDSDIRLSRKDGYLLTVCSWLAMSLLGAMPFWLSDFHITFTDAVFEAISGLTTTGSTVLTGLDHMPPGLLLWRGLLQWFGGIGIIVMAVALLPFLRIGGMQLYRMETSDQYDKFMPRIADICMRITAVYIALSVICAFLYWWFGMTPFEAVVHAMTTLSTGGYSTSDQSLGHFSRPTIQWTAIVFMMAGSLPFSVYIRYLQRFDIRTVLRDSQAPWFLAYSGGFALLTTAFLTWERPGPVLENLRLATFHVVSIISTTGYASSDYLTWGTGAATLFFFISMLGGCAGSTAGGIKAFRLIAMVKGAFLQSHKLTHPHGVFIIRLGNRPLGADSLNGMFLFFFIMMATLGLMTLGLSLTGLDFVTAISASVTSIANVGPGLGSVIGPSGTFAPLSDTAKWIIDAGMIAGRLEFLTVLVLFLPSFWQN